MKHSLFKLEETSESQLAHMLFDRCGKEGLQRRHHLPKASTQKAGGWVVLQTLVRILLGCYMHVACNIEDSFVILTLKLSPANKDISNRINIMSWHVRKHLSLGSGRVELKC